MRRACQADEDVLFQVHHRNGRDYCILIPELSDGTHGDVGGSAIIISCLLGYKVLFVKAKIMNAAKRDQSENETLRYLWF